MRRAGALHAIVNLKDSRSILRMDMGFYVGSYDCRYLSWTDPCPSLPEMVTVAPLRIPCGKNVMGPATRSVSLWVDQKH